MPAQATRSVGFGEKRGAGRRDVPQGRGAWKTDAASSAAPRQPSVRRRRSRPVLRRTPDLRKKFECRRQRPKVLWPWRRVRSLPPFPPIPSALSHPMVWRVRASFRSAMPWRALLRCLPEGLPRAAPRLRQLQPRRQRRQIRCMPFSACELTHRRSPHMRGRPSGRRRPWRPRGPCDRSVVAEVLPKVVLAEAVSWAIKGVNRAATHGAEAPNQIHRRAWFRNIPT